MTISGKREQLGIQFAILSKDIPSRQGSVVQFDHLGCETILASSIGGELECQL